MLADIQALDSRPGYETMASAWSKVPWTRHGHLSSLRTEYKPWAVGSSIHVHHSECCVSELSCLLLFTILGAPLEWQASVLAVDSVM